MSEVKTTLFPESQNRSVYFDVEEGIRMFENESGRAFSEKAAEILRAYGPIINQAYDEGYRDGREAAGV